MEEKETTLKTFPEILEDLAQELDLPQLSLDEQGNCEFLIGDDLILNIHYDDELGEILFYAMVDEVDDIPQWDDILIRMMRANYFWKDTRGFTLAMDHDSETIVLTGKQPEAFFKDADGLSAYLGVMAEVITGWRKTILEAYQLILPKDIILP